MTDLPDFPQPPRDEFDEEGRHVNPYVREEGPDGSVHDIEDGPTAIERSDMSRAALHTIEGLTPFLTPQGTFWLLYGQLLKLFPDATLKGDDEAAAMMAEVADTLEFREFADFANLHRAELRTIYECLLRMSKVCPGCGRIHGPGEGHGDDDAQPFQPGVYVNKLTGESVKVVRVEERRVIVEAEVAPGRWIDRMYDKPWAEDNLVPADKVEVLTTDADAGEATDGQ